MINLSVFLLSIALCESGNVQSKVGKRGELSAWQITPKVWKQHMPHLPFKMAHHSVFYSEHCATLHLRWLIKNGVPEDPVKLACAWNSGLSRYKHFTRFGAFAPSGSSIVYCTRVATTYNDLLKKEKHENPR